MTHDSRIRTRIGFRRDVKLFLAALVGYLIVVILSLLLLLQSSVMTTSELSLEAWGAIATSAARNIDDVAVGDRPALQRLLSNLVDQPGVIFVELDTPTGAIREGFPGDMGFTREIGTRHGSLRIDFEDAAVRHEEEKFKWVSTIVLLGTVCVTVLLVLYLPRIVRPIEEMLEHATELEDRAAGADEARYLVETFKRSIDQLRDQKEELARLHEIERARADDLERVSSTLKRSIASGFLAIDDDGRIVDTNQVAKEMLAIDPSAGQPLEEAIPPGPFATDLARSLQDRASLSRHETTHPLAQGDVTIGLTTMPLQDESGVFLGLIAIFTDLRRIRALEDRVREMQTLADLGEISAGIAHEFRNSLSTVLGYLRLAQRDTPDHASKVRIEAAEQEARLLSEAVSRLLHYSRPIEPDFQKVDLVSLAREIVARHGTEGVQISFEVDVPDQGTAMVRGDASLLRIVVENLLRNAIDAVSEKESGGQIGVAVRGGDHVEVTVTDDGPGIPVEIIPKLFLPFQSSKAGGFGLGLALSRKIVLLHDGDIELSRGKTGTVATISFPGD